MKVSVLAAGDNYIYLLSERGKAWVIDPTDSGPVERRLRQEGLRLQGILNTHPHADHTAGNAALKNAWHCPITGDGIPPGSGGSYALGETALEVIATPGHTRDSQCFYLPGRPARLFTGDTLFAGGCGRIFEGPAAELWASLRRLAGLPDATLVYPGHEYSLDNYAFALQERPGWATVRRRRAAVERLRQAGRLPVPTTISLEKETNLFLTAPDAETFAALRRRKDQF